MQYEATRATERGGEAAHPRLAKLAQNELYAWFTAFIALMT